MRKLNDLRGRTWGKNVPLDLATQKGPMSGANNRIQIGVRSTRVCQPGNTSTRLLRVTIPPLEPT